MAKRGGAHSPTRPVVLEICNEVGLKLIDEAEIDERTAAILEPPRALDPRVRAQVERLSPGGLYRHQALALERYLIGDDVCLATSTASGKSLAFIAAVANSLVSDPKARALALYPAKALIQDQLQKWGAFLEPLGLRFGFIDGSVPMEQRESILESRHVLLMTPDVLHAWLMSRVATRPVRAFLSNLKTLVLDETHAYDGVFGTNMAYLLRRLRAVAPPFQIVSSTATIADPAGFVEQLTGRRPVALEQSEDGAPASRKRLYELEPVGDRFEKSASLLLALSSGRLGKFLAFADSRKMVERLVATVHRMARADARDGTEENEDDLERAELESAQFEEDRVLPYRAGYEDEDRVAIQRALEAGTLNGVVSTSALELGIDIGDVTTVVLLGRPLLSSSFWQRIGRAGRKSEGVALILRGGDLDATSLRDYLGRRIEPNRLYLKNRYVQYAHALCAAQELALRNSGDSPAAFESLPAEFRSMLRNEIQQTEAVAQDLYPLKQRAQAGPHREFPIRAAGEQSFRIVGPVGLRLGTVTLGQALREAYPGAVYYYMARPYRVTSVKVRAGEITAKRERAYTTQPISQNKVFPRFAGGPLQFWRSESGFLIETEMQVGERVLGFIEKRGSNSTRVPYGPGSTYSQREMSRLFETTGVCWWFKDGAGASEDAAQAVLTAFSELAAVQPRDLGAGTFYSRTSPTGTGVCQGWCVYDATSGSLRLTKDLAERFADAVELAAQAAERIPSARQLVAELNRLLGHTRRLDRQSVDEAIVGAPRPAGGDAGESIVVVAPGQKAFRWALDGQVEEVTVRSVRYTPQGVMYDLEPRTSDERWSASITSIQPIPGESKLARYDAMTGVLEPIAEGEDVA